ncbi:hypothetical protein OROHE_011022 [Orobanche hederae]
MPSLHWRKNISNRILYSRGGELNLRARQVCKKMLQEQSRKEREELDNMLEENRRRVEEAQRREALELQRKEEERLQELEFIQRQKEEAARRRRVEEEEERANQMLSDEDWDGICEHVFGALACEVEALGLFCSAQ